ncbi:UvrD-like helicase, ATP-binding domain, P-loop containing nucleoside triphosphate hydrolase, partial [Tanacetum coccineum]
MHRNLNIVKEVLYSDSKVKEKYNICSFGYDSMVSQKLNPQVLLNLNESQRAVVIATGKSLVKVSSHSEEIYLEQRVKRLAECLGPVTGKRTMLEMKSFIEYVQERFNSSAPPLRSSLESLLFRKNMVSEELEDLFNSKPLQDDIVKSCLSLLKTLQISLEGLALPCYSNKYAIKQFCFERASVIFCTTSSSYKLHAVNMEPLKIVVIDEAAQLKEAESTIPLQLPGMKHAILVGDERQLPAMVNSNVSLNL